MNSLQVLQHAPKELLEKIQRDLSLEPIVDRISLGKVAEMNGCVYKYNPHTKNVEFIFVGK